MISGGRKHCGAIPDRVGEFVQYRQLVPVLGSRRFTLDSERRIAGLPYYQANPYLVRYMGVKTIIWSER